ncbi:hypothetical protein C8J57DRAFT_1516956 [Mycena rebaudengoi]|nr:hypothetical protein C8J57DRAFT_1516956 [Mycena rebaudengoi]
MSRLLPRTPSRWSATCRTSPHSWAPASRPSPTHRQRTQRGGEANVSSSHSDDTATTPGLFRHHPHARSEVVDQDVCVSALDTSVCKRVPFYPESRTSVRAFEANPSPVLDAYDCDPQLALALGSLLDTETLIGRTCPRTDGRKSLSSYPPCSLNAPSSFTRALSSTNAVQIPGLRARGVKPYEDIRVIHTRRQVCFLAIFVAT